MVLICQSSVGGGAAVGVIGDADGFAFASTAEPHYPMYSARHPGDVARTRPFGSSSGDTAAGAFQGGWLGAIQAAVGLVGCAAAFWARNYENRCPPVGPISLLPFIDDIMLMSFPSALNDGGEGGVLGQEVIPGFQPGEFVS